MAFLFQTINQEIITFILEFSKIHAETLTRILRQLDTIGINPSHLKTLYTHGRVWVIGPNDPAILKAFLLALGQIHNKPIKASVVSSDNEKVWMIQTVSYLQTGTAPTLILDTEQAYESLRQRCRKALLDKLNAQRNEPYHFELVGYIQLAYKLLRLHIEAQRNYRIKSNSLGAIDQIKKIHQHTLDFLYAQKTDIKDIVPNLPLTLLSTLLLRLDEPLVLLEKLKSDCKQQVQLIQQWEHELAKQEQTFRQAWIPRLVLMSKTIFQFLIQASYIPLATQLAIGIKQLFSVISIQRYSLLFRTLGWVVGMGLTLQMNHLSYIKFLALIFVSQQYLNLQSASSQDFQSLPDSTAWRCQPKTILRITTLLMAGIEALIMNTYAPFFLMMTAMIFSVSVTYPVQKTFPEMLDPQASFILWLSCYQVGYGIANTVLHYGQFLWGQWLLCQAALDKIRHESVGIPYCKAYCIGPTRWSFWWGRSNPLYLEWAQPHLQVAECQVRPDQTTIPVRIAVHCAPVATSRNPVLM